VSADRAPDGEFLAAAVPGVPGLRFRPPRVPDDYRAMNDAANAAREADGQFITSLEQFSAFYDHLSNCDMERDVFIAEVDGQVAGYGRCAWQREHAGDLVLDVICLLDPAWSRRGIGGALQAVLERRATEVAAGLRGDGPAWFQSMAPNHAAGRVALLLESGFAPVRYGYTMVRPTLDDQPDAPLPQGLEIREVRPEHLRAIWEADREAFRDHWGEGEGTEEQYQQFLADPVQGDTSLWRVAWDGDRVAGQVRSFVNAAENRRLGRTRGWVENISVRRPWRHRGLARALMAASFPLLRARGMTEGALGVDADNPTGALRVYESVGFVPVSGETTYRKQIP